MRRATRRERHSLGREEIAEATGECRTSPRRHHHRGPRHRAGSLTPVELPTSPLPGEETPGDLGAAEAQGQPIRRAVQDALRCGASRATRFKALARSDRTSTRAPKSILPPVHWQDAPDHVKQASGACGPELGGWQYLEVDVAGVLGPHHVTRPAIIVAAPGQQQRRRPRPVLRDDPDMLGTGLRTPVTGEPFTQGSELRVGARRHPLRVGARTDETVRSG